MSSSREEKTLHLDELQQPPQDDTEVTIEDKRQTIYFVSGLGADERIFQWLRCDGFRPVHIYWITPEKGESIESYAKRLAEQIEEEHPIIAGLSNGGMIAVELAKQLTAQKIILFSSVKHRSEVPFYFKVFRAFPIHRIMPNKSLLWAFYWLAYWLFSPAGTAQRALFKTILIETDPHFLKWALHKVVVWQNDEVPENIVHIHGKRDRIFPYRFVQPDHAIEGSGHLMVMNQAEEMSNLLETLIVQG